MKPVIAIDGHGGSGKGTIAQKLAHRFGFAYLDTGILYRAIACLDLKPHEIKELSIGEFLSDIQKISEEILRSEEMSKKASAIAKSPEIRKVVTQLLRDFVACPGDEYSGSILDGRDIGTVVVPDASCKIFITASLEVRAMRRFNSIKQSNPHILYEEVYENLKARDKQDQLRDIAPLTCDDSYVLIDTSEETIEESFSRAVKIVENSLAAFA